MTPTIMVACPHTAVATALCDGLGACVYDGDWVAPTDLPYYDVWVMYGGDNAALINALSCAYGNRGTAVLVIGDCAVDGECVYTLPAPSSVADIWAVIRDCQNKIVKYKTPFPITPDITLCVNTNTVSKGTVRLGLTDKETQLLIYLTQQGDKGANRDDILHHVWGQDGSLNSHSLETHVSNIRAKFEKTYGVGEIIEYNDKRYRCKCP